MDVETIKRDLAAEVRRRRLAMGWSQAKFASDLGTTQSRLAAAESVPESASIDLFLRALLALGATRKEIGAVIAMDWAPEQATTVTGRQFVERASADRAVRRHYRFEEPVASVSMYGPVLRPIGMDTWRIRHALAENAPDAAVRALLVQPEGGHIHGEEAWSAAFQTDAQGVLDVVKKASEEAYLTHGGQQITVPFRGYQTFTRLIRELKRLKQRGPMRAIKTVKIDPFAHLDWHEVRGHYDHRVVVRERLLQLLTTKSLRDFCRLALGIDDPAGNYSAAEHGLGPKILKGNARSEARLAALAGELVSISAAHKVPAVIRAADLAYLRIGVGSEMSCMMNPRVCWVANTRTIWTHLVIKHADNLERADEELELYRDNEITSEMAYALWTAIHRELDTAMTRIYERAGELSKAAGVTPGPIKYLWADAVANALYSDHFA